MAFLGELARYGDRVIVRPEDEFGLLDLPAVLANADPADTKLYCCGPAPLLAAMEQLCDTHPAGFLRTARFVARAGAPVRNAPFQVALARTGRQRPLLGGASPPHPPHRAGGQASAASQPAGAAAGRGVPLPAEAVPGVGGSAQVRAAPTDGQDFKPGVGVGRRTFGYKGRGRPPGLLPEAAPPQHDAPRAVLSKI